MPNCLETTNKRVCLDQVTNVLLPSSFINRHVCVAFAPFNKGLINTWYLKPVLFTEIFKEIFI